MSLGDHWAWRKDEQSGQPIKRRVLLVPEGKYKTKEKGLQVVLGEQRIIAKAVKIKRYESRVKQFRAEPAPDSNGSVTF